MGLIEGVIAGTVKDVKDPEGQGRIFVEFPWMGGKQGYWSPPATLMAGNKRGSWFMPEVGDEVLVAFDHGDVGHPYILGFLWNGQDKPPETDAHKRLIKSVKGHTILLDDTDGGEKIEITTSGNAKIAMDDANKSITIATKGGLKITMDDTANSITIQASQQVTVNAPKVTLDAATSVDLGQGASHPSVYGDSLLQYLTEFALKYTTHTHPGELAAGVLPVTPMIPVPPVTPPAPTLLSKVVKDA